MKKITKNRLKPDKMYQFVYIQNNTKTYGKFRSEYRGWLRFEIYDTHEKGSEYNCRSGNISYNEDYIEDIYELDEKEVRELMMELI